VRDRQTPGVRLSPHTTDDEERRQAMATVTVTVERDWQTTDEIAAAIQTTRESVVRWINRGVKSPSGKRVYLAATKIGCEWRVKKTDLDAFLNAMRNVAPEELGETEAEFRRRAAHSKRRALEALGS
jgi:hypothetical protein